MTAGWKCWFFCLTFPCSWILRCCTACSRRADSRRQSSGGKCRRSDQWEGRTRGRPMLIGCRADAGADSRRSRRCRRSCGSSSRWRPLWRGWRPLCEVIRGQEVNKANIKPNFESWSIIDFCLSMPLAHEVNKSTSNFVTYQSKIDVFARVWSQ